jgi:CubicO group peptidase (beta-lactamase class C family)
VTDPSGAPVTGTTGSGHDFKGANYANITIQQLIDHEGGWDRTLTYCAGAANYVTINGVPNPSPCDPMVQEYLIQQTLHAAFPGSFGATQVPTQMNDIFYWVTQNALEHVPGTVQVYSNFGYLLLSAIVAQATGSDLTSVAYTNILAPLGVPQADLSVFAFAPAPGSAQALRTPVMQTAQQCPSIYPGSNGTMVLGTSQGCLNPANWIGAATTLTTTKAMARLAGAYRIDNTSNLDAGTHISLDGPNNGKPLGGLTNSGEHHGDLPGVTNILRQLSSGTSYALMLGRDNTSDGWQNTLYPQIDAIIAGASY